MRELLKELNQRPIAYYPVYRKITGSTTGGLLLSQLMFWFAKKDKIFKTDAEIMEETLLTEKELRNAKKLIKQLDFITVSREGIPAKTYYKIDWELFEKVIKKDDKNDKKDVETSLDEKDEQDSPKGQNCVSQKGESIIEKSLTKTTTKNKKVKKRVFTSEDLKVAQYLFAYIKAIYAEAKEPNWEEWAEQVRLMRERDGRDLKAIRNLIDLIFVDNGIWDGTFWRANIRSTKKLRKQYEQIAYQISLAYKAKGMR